MFPPSTMLLWLWSCLLLSPLNCSLNMADLALQAKNMFHHAYEGYIRYAYPLDELRPLTCDGHDTWGSYSLTLVDALDTLAIMGNWTEFRRASRLLLQHLDANRNVNVSVFETNIRVVGGLISAHLLSRRANFDVEPSWPCSGPLLRKAALFAEKLLPAFDTPTGMPYGTVNLGLNSVPPNETTVTCVAGVGTYILEFGALSRLTGDPRFEEAALRALKSMWDYRSARGLLGNHIDIKTGRWVARESTIGGAVDSFFEYLVKGAILFRLPELDAMFRAYKESIDANLKHGDWFYVVDKDSAHVSKPIFQGLEAFWPSVLSLTGDLDGALRHITAYYEVWKQYGFIPESYDVIKRKVIQNQKSYHLRPEFIESVYYLYRVTKDPMFIQMGADVLHSIEHVTKTPCGYATVMDVVTHKLTNRMESFFLAETTKYLFLLFDEDNPINLLPGDPRLGATTQSTPHRSPSGNTCYPENGGWVFNTEAHPIDPGALNCCFQTDPIDDVSKDSCQDSSVEEALSLEKQVHDLMGQINTMEELLNLVDTAHPSDQLEPSGTPTGQCGLYDAVLEEAQDHMRRTVVNAMVGKAGDNSSVVGDLSLIKPPLLTCPYPPFHQRYTYSGQLATPIG